MRRFVAAAVVAAFAWLLARPTPALSFEDGTDAGGA